MFVSEQTLPFTVPFAAYGPNLLDNNCIKVSVIATDKSDSKEVYLAEKDVVPHSPTLKVTVGVFTRALMLMWSAAGQYD